MKLTVKQLRRIIKEEVETAMATDGGWSAEKTAASDPRAIAAALPGVLGKPEARPEICGELATAIVDIAKRVVAGDLVAGEAIHDEAGFPLQRVLLPAMKTTVDPEVPGSKNVVWSGVDAEKIISTFIGFIEDPKKKKPRGLRNKYSDAFEACDDNTRSGRAEKDWLFYEDESPEEDGTTVLWADPKVSGDQMWWDSNVGLWMELDGSPVW